MENHKTIPPWFSRVDRFVFFAGVAVVGFFALIPVSYLKWPSLGGAAGSLSLHHLVVFSLALFFTLITLNRIRALGQVPVYIALSTLVLASFFVSSFAAPDWSGASLKASLGIWAKGVVLGWVFYFLVRFKSCEKKWVWALSLIGGAAAVGALYEVMTGGFFIFERLPTPSRLSDFYKPDRGVAVGAVGQPLPFSFFLIGLFPLIFEEALQRKRAGYFISAFLVGTAVVFTYRRTGIVLLVFFAGYLVFKYLGTKRRETILGLLALFLVMAGAAFLLNPSKYDRFRPASVLAEIRESPRTYGVKNSLKLFSESPLLGVGPRRYEKKVDHQYLEDLIYETPDNQYLLILAEGGLVGFSVFFFFCLYLLKLIYFHWHRPPSRGLALSLFAFLISFAFFDAWYWSASLALFWSVSGVAAGLMDREFSLQDHRTL